MFNLLKKIFKSNSPEMVHPFFGPLDAECDGSPGDRWYGELASPMGEGKIGVCILAGCEGPTDDHVDFAKWITTQFQEVLSQVSPLLGKDYMTRMGVPLEGDVSDEYMPCSIVIPEDGNRVGTWDIAFTSKSDKGEHAFEVRFENGKPVSIGMDG